MCLLLLLLYISYDKYYADLIFFLTVLTKNGSIGLMKKVLGICSLLVWILIFSYKSFANEKGIEQLAALPENKIDIGIAALTLAREIYPDLDVRSYSAKIDRMVEKVRSFTRGSTDPEYRVRALNTYLYKEEGIQYDRFDTNAELLQNRYLNGILDTKTGSCVTMPLLYLAVAQRLGYPVYPVAAPQHLFLRYVDPRLKMQNIEATSGGGYSPDDEYKEVLHVSDRGFKSGAYLRTMSYREFLGELIGENGIYWGRQGDIERAIRYLNVAVKLNPKSADAYDAMARAYMIMSKRFRDMYKVTPQDALKMNSEHYLSQAEISSAKAEELGVVRLSNGNYVVEQKKAQEKYRQKIKGAAK